MTRLAMESVFQLTMLIKRPAVVVLTVSGLLGACSPTKFESMNKGEGNFASSTPIPADSRQPRPLPPDVADEPDPTPTPESTPIEPEPTPEQTPTPVATPVATPVPTPVSTPIATPVPTPVSTPIATPVPTPVSTPVATPVPTPVPTPVATPVPTPVSTPVATPTPAPTLTPTPVPTPIPTPTPTPVPTLSQYFYQDESANKVDILIINDNSSSMETEQRKMSERFPNFISAISDIDYQIGMTTTDLDSYFRLDGKIVTWDYTTTKILTPRTASADKAFKSTIQRKETLNCMSTGCPSTEEQPLKAMIRAVDHRFTHNNGFFRDKVDLVVVVLSDEDELSDGPSNATKPNEVINRMQAAFGDSKRFSVHGIIIKPGDKTCRSTQRGQSWLGAGGSYGTHVDSLAKLTGGSTWSICDTDYGKNLAEISRQVRQLVGTFDLQQAPLPGTLRVTLTPAYNIGYKLDGKKLIFDTPPPAGTRIDVSYGY